MAFKVPNEKRVITGMFSSTAEYGNNGAFRFKVDGKEFLVIASDGKGWEHASVTLNRPRCPTWEEMCMIKEMFWDEEDCVIQYHPPKHDWISNSKYCLHLWRPIGIELPRPPNFMVGIK